MWPLITYLRLLDANEEGADWREVERIVLHIDADREPDRARRAFNSHLARAKRMSGVGYRRLLRRMISGFHERASCHKTGGGDAYRI